ncbi:MAG: IclR family transcriptional regulator C-terminal domain-containing protein, partial [Pseudomonadota bacterium]
QTGTAFDDEEHADGLRCVAAPIIGENGQPVAAVSVSGPDTRLTRERLPDIRQHVRRIAGEITAEFGGVRT